ncbi:potassium transporter KtrA [Fusobacterium necrophorum subsp. funduliforme]|uniref:Trk system potassium uptake protein TrkA, N-terminal domain protein n=6 Tax=Fusobacterium necrophorum TaxID=859 RepID=A0AAN4AT03_9FUSO|nr:TrkA family potassium uptake protein [Fusobacterium necrophorum]AVQ22070.1 TrkA family potassium uptake protein [Fusobacterium necrophorum subsp. funduliforme]AYV93551.1 TrkA family potassium uptake protein [Fusobacterium necrophorum subsp. funduliforme]AYV95718.1 TrkA family potassium uptake protein [Fusobacterium necrophorum subsp. funduliforme]AYZ73907.1 TrkA family potassium uptake protein [Fusobacterium necrophorum]AZW10216.1 TrkA family potassium uptake protein [Fusobacterium necropho
MKQYLVIGLGRFGRSVAKTLYESDQEVMAVDVSEDLVQDMINDYKVENAMVLDGTDLTSLQEIGAQNFDTAFVCMRNLEASILTTLNLRELGVSKIIAKAGSREHGKVLEKIGASKIVYPEEYMGRRIAQLVMEPNMIEHLRFSSDFLLAEIKAPNLFWNKTLIELNVRNKYNANIVGIRKANDVFYPNPAAETLIEKGDILVVITDSKTARTLESLGE